MSYKDPIRTGEERAHGGGGGGSGTPSGSGSGGGGGGGRDAGFFGFPVSSLRRRQTKKRISGIDTASNSRIHHTQTGNSSVRLFGGGGFTTGALTRTDEVSWATVPGTLAVTVASPPTAETNRPDPSTLPTPVPPHSIAGKTGFPSASVTAAVNCTGTSISTSAVSGVSVRRAGAPGVTVTTAFATKPPAVAATVQAPTGEASYSPAGETVPPLTDQVALTGTGFPCASCPEAVNAWV